MNTQHSNPVATLPAWPARDRAAAMSEVMGIVGGIENASRSDADDGTPEHMAAAALNELIAAQIEAATLRGFIAGKAKSNN